MNPLSTLVESPAAATPAPAAFPATRLLYWSVRRELWESRWLYLGPLIAAGVFLLGFLISTVRLPAQMRALAGLDPMRQHEAVAAPFHMASGFLMLIGMVVGAFYCVEASQTERRDRSILFWKSLPVSDLTTVAAKAMIPLLVLPLLIFAITFALQLVMLLASSAVLAIAGAPVALLWTRLSLFRMAPLLLYHLIAIHALWHAPFYGWLLLVSAWARRAALLWAVLPPVAIGVFERIDLGTSYFTSMPEYRISGGGNEALTAPDTFPMDLTTHPTVAHFLASPGLWIGLALTALFLAAAVRLRHRRGPA